MSEALLPVADGAATRRALLGLLGQSPVRTALALLATVCATIAGLLVPPLLGRIVDAVIDGAETSRIDLLAAGLLLAGIAQAGLTALAIVRVASLGEHVLAEVREDVVERVLHLPLADVEAAGLGDVVARVSGDVDAVSEASREAIPELVAAGFAIGLTVVGLGILDWRLALAGFAVLPVQVLATRWYLRRSAPVYAEERTALGRRTGTITEVVAGAPTITALRLGPRRTTDVADRSVEANDTALHAARIRSKFFGFLNVAELTGLASVLVVGFFAVRADAITVGTATAGALYFHRLFDPFNSLLGLLDTAQEATAAFARLVGVLQAPVPDPPETVEQPADGSVSLAGVSFEYQPGHPVLHHVDLDVPDACRMALVGPSGAGKTTVARLVAGIDAPTGGELRIGGLGHRELHPVVWRTTVNLVSQDAYVFSGTIADNLLLADPEADEAALRGALDAVDALGWVDRLDDGLHAEVGDGARALSAVEANQLALARVALRPARVVIFDEATAEAGSTAARQLDDALARVASGRTSIVIAHRLTQARDADRIAVLEHGRLVEHGTHAELAGAAGQYAELWRHWQAARPESTG
ncbi:MAG: ABC transporter ATP-binding protein [Actinomycetota bacterium]